MTLAEVYSLDLLRTKAIQDCAAKLTTSEIEKQRHMPENKSISYESLYKIAMYVFIYPIYMLKAVLSLQD